MLIIKGLELEPNEVLELGKFFTFKVGYIHYDDTELRRIVNKICQRAEQIAANDNMDRRTSERT